FAIAGHWKTNALEEKAAPISFLDFKGVIISLFKRLGLSIDFKTPSVQESFLHPAQQAELVCGSYKLGTAGTLHPAVMEKMDISYETCVLEVRLDFVEKAMQNRVTFVPFSRQVPSSRDISIEVDEQMTHQSILERISGFNPKNLASIQLKSIYQGDKIAAGKKNMVYSLVYQAMDKTLTDEEVNKVHNKLREKLVQNGDILLR
ncbi:MAG TPA: phenylalanine--tRNA ligase subunit beta, partial [Fibrobacteraceae bacterium]|nr:phenylalanine--tRNA ligase subunit beta [Fibrobacteraceae bacterium]